tara:strand:- start:586 stop:993 length:408 start_codon:yes stop_codon:yes gene_type:complete
MPKLIPVPDEVSQPYWDAVNSRKLVLQYCSDCAKLQYPINKTCYHCNGSESLEWKEVEGKGEIIAAIVIEDGRLNRRMPDQPYNLAVISLDEDPSINFYSNLPGTQPYKAVIGSKVSLIFEQVSDDQLIPEWIVS